MIEQSSKLMFVMELLEELKRGSHRVLIFSHSTKMLDIIQEVLIQKVTSPFLNPLFLAFYPSYENRVKQRFLIDLALRVICLLSALISYLRYRFDSIC